MRAAYRFSILTLVVAATTVQSAVTAGETERPEPIAPGKFIPTFAVKYGGTPGWPPAEEAARFDLLDVSSSMGYARVHASPDGNTWQTIPTNPTSRPTTHATACIRRSSTRPTFWPFTMGSCLGWPSTTNSSR